MDIGTKLQALRKQKGLSQRELAARAGLTNGTISLIEKNRTSPSVASLKSLLDAIPMSMSEFFSTLDDDRPPGFVHRAADFIELGTEGVGTLSLRQICDAGTHQLQMLHETYPPGADTGDRFMTHEGEEAGIVVRGKVEITVDGVTETLGRGDGYLFDSRLPHRFRNTGATVCEIISACTPPTF